MTLHFFTEIFGTNETWSTFGKTIGGNILIDVVLHNLT